MERLYVNDEVEVIAGRDRGKRGKVIRVLREQNQVVVEGINQVKRHVRGTQERAGSVMVVNAPMDASKVMPVDPQSGKATRVRFEDREGTKVRVAVKSGAVLDRKTES